eukprot:3407929-Amphidinium_carterae.1
MWYKASESIAVRSLHGAKRQLGSAIVACSKADAYLAGLEAITLLEARILNAEDTSLFLYQWTR